MRDPAFEARVAKELTTLKGAPLSCLFALLLLNRPVGVMELISFTGWKKDAVRDGLAKLRVCGYAVEVGRYDSWQLTDKGYQLPLARALGEGDLTALASSSSSSLTINDHEELKLPLPQNKREGDLTALPPEQPLPGSDHPDFERLVDLLQNELGCPRKRAVEVGQALEAGYKPEWIELQIWLWTYYGLTRGADTFRWGKWAVPLAAIKEGTPCGRFKFPFRYHDEQGRQIRALEAAAEWPSGCEYMSDCEFQNSRR